jgi:PhnB protein
MTLTTYVNFNGRCAEAFRYYETHLGGQIVFLMMHEETPGGSGVPAHWQQKVLHATMTLGGATLSGADIPDAHPMRSAYLSLHVTSDAEAERIYAALSDGGKVFTTMQETFFASRFGQFQDRFGLNWVVLHERPRPAGA